MSVLLIVELTVYIHRQQLLNRIVNVSGLFLSIADLSRDEQPSCKRELKDTASPNWSHIPANYFVIRQTKGTQKNLAKLSVITNTKFGKPLAKFLAFNATRKNSALLKYLLL